MAAVLCTDIVVSDVLCTVFDAELCTVVDFVDDVWIGVWHGMLDQGELDRQGTHCVPCVWWQRWDYGGWMGWRDYGGFGQLLDAFEPEFGGDEENR